MTAQPQAQLTGSPAVRGQLPLTPGRWFALFIGVPVLLALIGFTGLNFVALAGQASYPVRDIIPVRGGQVSAQVNSGDVTLRQGAGGGTTAQLTGTAHYSLFRPTIRISGSTITFPCRFAVGNCSLNATFQVPAGTAASLYTDGGDATVPRFSGSPLTVGTGGGNLTAGDLDGTLRLDTGGGDLTAAALGGSVQLITNGGNISVQAFEGRNPQVDSGGGDVYLVFTTVPDNLLVTSNGGNVTLVLPSADYADYKLSLTSDGGNVSGQPQNDQSSANLLTVDSGGGNITFREAS
jgi:hypothetical protein